MSRLKASVHGALPRRTLTDHSAPIEVMPQGDQRMDVFSNAIVHYERREDFAREISTLWKRAQATFLTIGEYLTLAKAKLPHGEFNSMIERDLPFSPNTGFQIRMAAEAVKSGRLVASTLPNNYSTIYQISTLPDHALEQAKKSGLLRPDVRRSEIVAFKKKVQAMTQPVMPSATRELRIAELRRRIEEMEAEIADLERLPGTV